MVMLKVNARVFEIDDAEMPLLWAIRDIVGLKGRSLAAVPRSVARARYTATAAPYAPASRPSRARWASR